MHHRLRNPTAGKHNLVLMNPRVGQIQTYCLEEIYQMLRAGRAAGDQFFVLVAIYD
jgi:hypothetical protein